MKKTLLIIGIVVAIVGLIVFNKLISKKVISNTYSEVKKGIFEITVTNSGELIAEKSLDIKGPEIRFGSHISVNNGQPNILYLKCYCRHQYQHLYNRNTKNCF